MREREREGKREKEGKGERERERERSNKEGGGTLSDAGRQKENAQAARATLSAARAGGE